MKRKAKYKKRETTKKVLIIVGVILACIALFIWVNEPAFFGIRSSLPYRIAVLAAVSAALCLFAFHPFFTQPVYGKVLLVAGAVLVWFTLFLSDRAVCLLLFAYGTLSLALDACFFLYGVWKESRDDRYRFKNIPRLTQILTAAFALLLVLRETFKWEYVQSEFPFWLPSLIAAVCLGVLSLVVVLFLKGLPWRKREKFLVPVLTLFISFLFVWVALCVFNYTLDSGVPQRIEADVCDRDIHSGGRTPTVYELTLQTRDGKEIALNVSQKVWHELKEGDRIIVSLYDGALGESYYIYEE